MALKLVKVTVNLEVKVDNSDPDDLKERVYEELQTQLESEELVFTVDTDEEEEIDDEN